MKVELEPGQYVVAVSGGVDSIVLLDLLAKYQILNTKYQIIVAHVNEGLRPDSHLDQKLVREVAGKYGLKFFTTNLKLKSPAEALGREVRYRFLNKLVSDLKADGLITAHHQDDLIETAIINLLRGTKRRGITSLKSHPKLLRPLLKFTKKQIYDYARQNKLKWREDSMNKDEKFLRNYIRLRIMPKIPETKREKLLEQIEKLGEINLQIDKILQNELVTQTDGQKLNRNWFISLPINVANETMAAWLRQNHTTVDSMKLNKLTISAKTLKAGKSIDINKSRKLAIEKNSLQLV